jgi:hypothetical protein
MISCTPAPAVALAAALEAPAVVMALALAAVMALALALALGMVLGTESVEDADGRSVVVKVRFHIRLLRSARPRMCRWCP